VLAVKEKSCPLGQERAELSLLAVIGTSEIRGKPLGEGAWWGTKHSQVIQPLLSCEESLTTLEYMDMILLRKFSSIHCVSMLFLLLVSKR
jgi:hypothetical protein